MRLLPLFLALTIAGCAATTATPPADLSAAWQARQTLLASVDTWDLRGRVAIRLGADGGQAALHWVRERERHRVDLIFPFGAGSIRLTQDERGAELRDTENRIYRGVSARGLLMDATGWELPIDELNFWALGLPAPGAVTRTAFDDEGRLAELEQGEWQVVFGEYFEFSNYVVPSRIEIRRKSAVNSKSVDVRLSVQDWTLSASQ